MKRVLVLIPPNNTSRNVVRDFVYGCWCSGRRIGGMQMPPLNMLYVTTVLRQNDVDADLVDAGIEPERYEETLARIKEYAIVILLSSTNSFKNDATTLVSLKSGNPDIRTILFGSHPTFMPEYCLAESCVDILAQREPEFVIRDVVCALLCGGKWDKTAGIAFRAHGTNIINPAYPFADMDELPIPDRSLLPRNIDYFNPVVKRMPYTTVQTSRGCPGKCIFCTVPDFYGRKIRCRSVENVMQEIRHIVSLGYREIFFRDETFTVYKNRNLDICDKIQGEGINISWIANARVDMIDRESLERMKSAGCHLIKFGVESGSQEILDKIGKGITLQQTADAFSLCRELGIDTHAHIMLGNYGETEGTIEGTIKFALRLKPTTASFGICTPFPGTQLFSMVKTSRPDILDGSDASLEKLHSHGFFNDTFTDVKKEYLEKSVFRAYRSFYLRPHYLLGRLGRIDSPDELWRLLIAASNIFRFCSGAKD